MINFNKQQLEAINIKDGACAVIAGAGSGKSTVLIHRIQSLVNSGVEESEILATTFTKNSALDLKKKLNKINIKEVTTGTFHSICNRILKSEGNNYDFNIPDYELDNLFSDILGKKSNYKDIINFISYQKNYMIGEDNEFVYKESEYDNEFLRQCYKEYEKYKRINNKIDLNDLLLKAYDVLIKNPNKYTYKYILVDEHQDSNLIQNKLIKLLCPSKNVFCVFDYRQAIYTFRGGNPEYCMNFSKEYKNAKVINLDVNYRSSNNIVNNANNFIKKYYGNYKYYSDSISDIKDNGNINILTNYDKSDEAYEVVDKIENYLKSGVKGNNISILYRLNSQTAYIENELKKRSIDYDIDENNDFFEIKEINIVLCMMRLIKNPKDNSAYEQLFISRVHPFEFFKSNVMMKDLLDKIKQLSGKTGLSFVEASELITPNKSWQLRNLKEFSNILSKLTRQHKQGDKLCSICENIILALKIDDYIQEKYTIKEDLKYRKESLINLTKFLKNNTVDSFIEYVYGRDKKKKGLSTNKIQLMSIHKSKGLEFKKVFIIGIEDGKFPHDRSPLEDEARLFYVAITRPKEDLYLSQIYDDNQFVKEYFN